MVWREDSRISEYCHWGPNPAMLTAKPSPCAAAEALRCIVLIFSGKFCRRFSGNFAEPHKIKTLLGKDVPKAGRSTGSERTPWRGKGAGRP